MSNKTTGTCGEENPCKHCKTIEGLKGFGRCLKQREGSKAKASRRKNR